MSPITLERTTKETSIKLSLDLSSRETPSLSTGIPFFDHMLNAMAFHGGFFLKVEAKGDLEVDDHHLVEDVGLVLGEAFRKARESSPSIQRYGHSIIPMDEALSEVVVDACNRPYWVIKTDYPQPYAGKFDLSLIREFLIALTNRAGINLHAHGRYADNGHHMAESLFKALGRALAQAHSPKEGPSPSTKGVL